MAHFQPDNSHGVATRFKPGESGNPRGIKRGTASIREHWNALLAENEDGTPRHTLADLWRIVEAAHDDKTVSTPRRIAARLIIEMNKGGRRGIEALQLIFDRLEGKAPSYMTLSTESADLTKRIILIHRTEADAQEARALPSSEPDDEQGADP